MVAEFDTAMLDEVFDSGPGDTPETRAHNSERAYVRSLSQIAEYTPEAKGRKLSASEALDAYGLSVLREVASEGTALLCESPRAAGRLVERRRKLLGLDTRHVAKTAGVTRESVERLESGQRIPIRQAERVARALGLDERKLSWKAEAPAENERVAVRLRTIGDDEVLLTAHAVSAIAEASWVAATQLRLQHKLGILPQHHGIVRSTDYGGPGRPAFKHGYSLAADAREKLGLGLENPLESLRELAEVKLGIPVIQVEMGSDIAGATIDIGGQRAIILNLDGQNRNALVRRSTMAHELGHLLYDPPGNLESLRVDEYDQLDYQPTQVHDPVEQRANAFGAEFIAPRSAVAAHYEKAVGGRVDSSHALLDVMNHFGISHTVARYQLCNGLGIPLEPLPLPGGSRPELKKWDAVEGYTVNYHPLERLKSSRVGRFSAVVVRAARERHISWDSAAEMLECEEAALQEAMEAIAELFPAVFNATGPHSADSSPVRSSRR